MRKPNFVLYHLHPARVESKNSGKFCSLSNLWWVVSQRHPEMCHGGIFIVPPPLNPLALSHAPPLTHTPCLTHSLTVTYFIFGFAVKSAFFAGVWWLCCCRILRCPCTGWVVVLLPWVSFVRVVLGWSSMNNGNFEVWRQMETDLESCWNRIQ